MKMHPTLIQKLLKIMEINSGWSEEWKLKAALEKLDMSVYTTQNGNQILVDSAELKEHWDKAMQVEQAAAEVRVQGQLDKVERNKNRNS